MSAQASVAKNPVPEDIRHLVVSYAGDMCLLANLDRQVWAIDVKSRSILSSFSCLIDIGTNRLAVSEDGCFCGAAAYQRHGVACHQTLDGSLIWRRKDLKKAQRLRFDPHDGSLVVCIEGRPCHVLDHSSPPQKSLDP